MAGGISIKDFENPCIISIGPRGIKWLKKDDVIDGDNPVMFTCAECGKTSAPLEEGHEKGWMVKLMNQLRI